MEVWKVGCTCGRLEEGANLSVDIHCILFIPFGSRRYHVPVPVTCYALSSPYPMSCTSSFRSTTIIMYKFSCTYYHEGCSKRFRSQSGRTYHDRSAHGNNNIIHNQNENENGPENEDFHDDNLNHQLPGEDYFAPVAEHDNVPPPALTQLETGNIHSTAPQKNIHPHINGTLFISFFSLLLIGNYKVDHVIKTVSSCPPERLLYHVPTLLQRHGTLLTTKANFEWANFCIKRLRCLLEILMNLWISGQLRRL
jgi:hypothetical protein